MSPDDQELLAAFEQGVIPLERWDQRTHVSVAYLYLSAHEYGDALEKMRTGIQAFNARNQIPESPTSGYNETTTVALFKLIDATMRAYGEVFPTSSADEFCETHPQLMSKHILRLFYSPQQRMRPNAKSEFVEPDLAPLPTIENE